MIDRILKTAYFAIISLALISILFAVWTSFVFISQPSKTSEIIQVMKDIYKHQKSLTIDVINLTEILLEDKKEDILLNTNTSKEKELLAFEKSQKPTFLTPPSTSETKEDSLEILIEPFNEDQNMNEEETGSLFEETRITPENVANPLEIVTEPSEKDKEPELVK